MPEPNAKLSARARRGRIMFLSLPFFVTAFLILESVVRTSFGIAKPNSVYLTAAPALIIGLATAWAIVRAQERRRARRAAQRK